MPKQLPFVPPGWENSTVLVGASYRPGQGTDKCSHRRREGEAGDRDFVYRDEWWGVELFGWQLHCWRDCMEGWYWEVLLEKVQRLIVVLASLMIVCNVIHSQRYPLGSFAYG